jgi:hypothetical protein
MANDTGAEEERLLPGPSERAIHTCPVCGRPFTYQRKAQPRRYCSKRCADAASRQRQASQPLETRTQPPIPANPLPWGTCHGPAIAAATVPPLACAICGRPKQGDATGWRVRAYRYSPRRDYLILCICPAHYRPGEPPPHIYGDSSPWR